jgi:hypothetical protein
MTASLVAMTASLVAMTASPVAMTGIAAIAPPSRICRCPDGATISPSSAHGAAILASRELRITARDGPADCLSSEGEPGWVSARSLNYADTWCVRTSVSRILGIDICVACLRFLS